MELIGIILFGIVIFIIFGCLGWIFQIFKYMFDFLLIGFSKSLGCLFWIFIIVIIILGLSQ